jgi:hypothetical protein
LGTAAPQRRPPQSTAGGGTPAKPSGRRPAEARPGRWIGDRFIGPPAGRWEGETVVVAASGPSLTREDLEYVKARARVIVINATFQLAPWADVLYAADFPFWEAYLTKIRATFRGELWSVSEMARDKFGTYWIRHGSDAGFNPEPDTINGGGNSGYQGIHLAATFGATRILLLGFDMQLTGGREHWHGKHVAGLPNGRGFPHWMKALDILYQDLKGLGVEMVNCTRKTAWRTAPQKTIEEALP